MDNKFFKKGERIGLKNRVRSFFGQEFFKNSIIHWLLIGTIFLNLADWVLLFIFIHPVEYSLILHYNVYFGVDLIGDWWQIYIIPFMGIAFFGANLGLAYRFYKKKERIASHILLLAALMIQIGLIISSAGIVMINY